MSRVSRRFKSCSRNVNAVNYLKCDPVDAAGSPVLGLVPKGPVDLVFDVNGKRVLSFAVVDGVLCAKYDDVDDACDVLLELLMMYFGHRISRGEV